MENDNVKGVGSGKTSMRLFEHYGLVDNSSHSKIHIIPIKAANRRPEKSHKWKSLFSMLVLLCVHFMMSG